MGGVNDRVEGVKRPTPGRPGETFLAAPVNHRSRSVKYRYCWGNLRHTQNWVLLFVVEFMHRLSRKRDASFGEARKAAKLKFAVILEVAWKEKMLSLILRASHITREHNPVPGTALYR